MHNSAVSRRIEPVVTNQCGFGMIGQVELLEDKIAHCKTAKLGRTRQNPNCFKKVDE